MPKNVLEQVVVGNEIILNKDEEPKEIDIPEYLKSIVGVIKLRLLEGQIETAPCGTDLTEFPTEEGIVIEFEKNNSGIRHKHTVSREFSFPELPFIVLTPENNERKLLIGSYNKRPVYLFVQNASYDNKNLIKFVTLRFELSMSVKKRTLFEKLLGKNKYASNGISFFILFLSYFVLKKNASSNSC